MHKGEKQNKTKHSGILKQVKHKCTFGVLLNGSLRPAFPCAVFVTEQRRQGPDGSRCVRFPCDAAVVLSASAPAWLLSTPVSRVCACDSLRRAAPGSWRLFAHRVEELAGEGGGGGGRGGVYIPHSVPGADRSPRVSVWESSCPAPGLGINPGHPGSSVRGRPAARCRGSHAISKARSPKAEWFLPGARSQVSCWGRSRLPCHEDTHAAPGEAPVVRAAASSPQSESEFRLRASGQPFAGARSG